MAYPFKKRYADIMHSQLGLNVSATQLSLVAPDDEIITLLKGVHVIPEDTDSKLSVVPDVFKSWKMLVNKLRQTYDQRLKALVSSGRTAEWKAEMEAWGVQRVR